MARYAAVTVPRDIDELRQALFLSAPEPGSLWRAWLQRRPNLTYKKRPEIRRSAANAEEWTLTTEWSLKWGIIPVSGTSEETATVGPVTEESPRRCTVTVAGTSTCMNRVVQKTSVYTLTSGTDANAHLTSVEVALTHSGEDADTARGKDQELESDWRAFLTSSFPARAAPVPALVVEPPAPPVEQPHVQDPPVVASRLDAIAGRLGRWFGRRAADDAAPPAAAAPPGPAPIAQPAPAPAVQAPLPLTVAQKLGCDTKDVRLQVMMLDANTTTALEIFVDVNGYLRTREPDAAAAAGGDTHQAFSFERDRAHPDVDAYFLVTGTPHNHTCHPEHAVSGRFTWKMHGRSHVRTDDESLQVEFLLAASAAAAAGNAAEAELFYLHAHAHPNRGHRNYITFHPNEAWPLQLRNATLDPEKRLVRPVDAARFRVVFC